jgi:UTP:GlnB (protein PII) uridylyltransferase
VAGPDNHQHIVQDYTLADHLLKTVEATRKSRYFKALTPEEQFRVTTAAFFHDLHKRTGPANLRAVARISVDPHHPGRSAEAALELLPNLGYTPAQIDDIVTLIDHHQLLGNMAKPDGDPTSPRSIRLAADKLGSASRLRMLRALTEGDIRCVRMDVPGRTWYDADLAERLQRFSQKILDELNRRGLTHRPVQPAEFSQ